MNSTIFNSLNTFYKNPTGPLKIGNVLTLRIKLKKCDCPSNVQVIFYEYCAYWKLCIFQMDFEKDEEEYVYFKTEIYNFEINIYEYYFSYVSFGNKKFIKKNDNSWEAHITDNQFDPNWQLTVYQPTKTHPNMNCGIMYQIFPDRFYNSGKVTNLPKDRIYRSWGELPYYDDSNICSDFFGGDLNGIIEKLPYLKSLNISVLYLNPIWESQSNHRYNTGSYENVDPVLGTMDDLKLLIDKAHSMGIIIILDTVLNHTGSDSIYFNRYNRYDSIGAYNSKNSSFRDWYFFHDDDINSYESWWGFDTLPKINQNNSSFIEYFFGEGGIIDKWYSLGIDGLRLDVADELDNSTLMKIYDASKRNRDSIIIVGEVWDDASNKVNYGHRMNYFLGHELTSVMNYPVRDAIVAYIRYGDFWAGNLERTLISIFIENYPREIAYSLMNFLSTHDTVRVITKLAGKEVDNHDKNWQYENDTLSTSEMELGKSRLIISYLLIYFLPGIPCIFYGDEIGIYGQKDPFCRKCFPWDKMDNKLLDFFKNLGALRNKEAVFLRDADFSIITIDNEKCIYCRSLNNRYFYIFINRLNFPIYISSFMNKICNPQILFTVGEKTNLSMLDSFGALIIEFNL